MLYADSVTVFHLIMSLDMPEWREIYDWLVGKATLTNGLLLGWSEVLRSLRYYLWTQSQWHHTIDCLEKRGVEREALDNLPWKDERGPSSIRQTLEMFQRWHWGNFWEMDSWSGLCGLFQVHRYHLELNSTELCLTAFCLRADPAGLVKLRVSGHTGV